MQRNLIEHTPTVARINVTPIIDVALVLVIILLITAPMIATADMDVNLPVAKTRSVDDEIRIGITLSQDGQLAIDDQIIARRSLVSALSKRMKEASSDNILVVVRADEGAPYQTVRGILKDARTAGAKRIAIATRQHGGVKS